MRKQWIAAGLAFVMTAAVAVSVVMARVSPAQKCAAEKRKAAGKKVSAKLVCQTKSVLDPGCLTKADAKFVAAFGKAGTVCPGDATSVEGLADSCVGAFLTALPGSDKCRTHKVKAAGKAVSNELVCTGKDLGKPGTEPGCSANQDGKLTAAFAKAGVCTGDAQTADGLVHGCRDTISGALLPATTTTTVTSTTSTSTTSTSVTTTSTTSTTSTSVTTTSSTSTTSTSTSTTTSTSLPPVCGNHIVESGETCDDGNTVDESDAGVALSPLDTCPKICRIGPCTATTSSQTATVSLTLPFGVTSVAGVTLFVDYPDTLLSLPGAGSAVSASIGNLQAGSFGVPNDLDYGLLEVLASTSSIAQGRVFTITFKTCQGAPSVQASDFTCLVKDASDAFGLPVVGTTCTVTVP